MTDRAYDPRGGCLLVTAVLVVAGACVWLFHAALWLWASGAPR